MKPNITITASGPKGIASMGGIAAGAGPLLGDCRGNRVNLASTSADGGKALHFVASGDLASALPPGGLDLAPGVRVEVGAMPAAGVTVEGPGADAFKGSYGIPGMKASLPSLPAGWAALISREAAKRSR